MESGTGGEINEMHGMSVIVIHPGSLHLRIGRASDSFPHSIPHCICRREKRNLEECKRLYNPTSWTSRADTKPMNPNQDEACRTAGRESALEAIAYRDRLLGRRKVSTKVEELWDLNSGCEPEVTQMQSHLSWTDTKDKEYIIGEDALYLSPDDRFLYPIHWPFALGDFNPEYSGPLPLLNDLEDIWMGAIETYMELKRGDLKHYKAILLIPDQYNRSNVNHLVGLLIDRLGFSAAIVLQESVCASIGAGLTTCCVIDVGDQKTSITCIEDGQSINSSRITLNYGGRDITNTFHWLLQSVGFPYRECSLNSHLDILLLQELKHTNCRTEKDNEAVSKIQFLVRPPGHAVTRYNMYLGDERTLAPLALFYPELLAVQGKDLVRTYRKGCHLPSDANDEEYILNSRVRQEERGGRKKGGMGADGQGDLDDGANGGGGGDLDLDMDGEEDLVMGTGEGSQRDGKPQTAAPTLDPSTVLPLHEAVVHSIEACGDEEMKRRCYGSIILTGGGLGFSGIEDWLQSLLWQNMPPATRIQLRHVEVITTPKDLDSMMVSWKGGAIVSMLDSAQELWLTAQEWKAGGARALREKCSFIW